MSTRNPVTRLLVSTDVPQMVDNATLEIAVRTKSTKWTKTDINSALVEVALKHLDEVAEVLQGGRTK